MPDSQQKKIPSRKRRAAAAEKPVEVPAARSEFSPRRLRLLICCVLAISILAIYAPLASSAFINYDDDMYVSQNPAVQHGLSLDGLVWAFTTVKIYYWQPLTWLSHMLDCQLFGLNPGPQHMVNVLFHAANAVLLFLLLDRITGRLWLSALAAALFAFHPLRVESVAWIAERKDVLSSFFFLITLFAYWRYVAKPSGRSYAWVCVAYALALMSKPTVVSLPFLLLLLDFWPFGRLSFDRAVLLGRIREKIPLVAMAALVCGTTFFGQHEFHAIGDQPFAVRLMNAITAYVRYMGLTFLPRDLAILYPYHADFTAGQIAGCLVLLGAITWLALTQARRYPYLLFGWLWFTVGLLPTIGLVQVGPQALADRFSYLPSIGLLVALVWGFYDVTSRWRFQRAVLVAFAAVVVPVLAVLSAQQVPVWKDSVTVFTRAADRDPNDAIIQHDLAYALAAAGRPAEAIPHYRESLRMAPDTFRAYYNLGRALVDTGHPLEAIPDFEEVLRRQPAPEYAADTHNALAIVLVRTGRPQEAEAHFREAARLKPNSPEIYNNLGSLLAQRQDLPNALAAFTEAVRLNPNYAQGHRNRGFALLQLGRRPEALAEFAKTVELAPDDLQAARELNLLRQR